MRYREVDPLKKLAGIAWAVLSLGWAIRAVWAISQTEGDDPKRTLGCIAFAVAGGFFAAMGLAIAFERQPRRRWRSSLRNTGVVVSIKSFIFHLAFFTLGLAMLLVPAVIPGVVKGTGNGKGDWWKLPGWIVVSLCCLAAGGYGLWVIFARIRKRRQRSLKSAQEVAEARERRLRARGKLRRKRP